MGAHHPSDATASAAFRQHIPGVDSEGKEEGESEREQASATERKQLPMKMSNADIVLTASERVVKCKLAYIIVIISRAACGHGRGYYITSEVFWCHGLFPPF